MCWQGTVTQSEVLLHFGEDSDFQSDEKQEH